jgi:hypothetical protein
VCYDSPCTLNGTAGTSVRWLAHATLPSSPRDITPRASRASPSPISAVGR